MIRPNVARYDISNLLAGKPGHSNSPTTVTYEVCLEASDYRTAIRQTDGPIGPRTPRSIPIEAMIPGGYAMASVQSFMQLFGNPDRVLNEVGPGPSPIDLLGKEWNPAAQYDMFRNGAIRQANLIILNHLRDTNRALLNDLEQMNPIDASAPQSSVMLALAQTTHQSWLAGEKEKPYYVSYTQNIHEALIALALAGKLDDNLTASFLTNPSKKTKITAQKIKESANDPLVKNLEKAMGRKLDSGFKINTVAADWNEALSLNISDEWTTKRPSYLYSLQADSVAAVYATLLEDDLMTPLSTALSERDKEGVMDGLVDILRAINVGWRVNNAWGGWNDALQNRPFGLANIGGIGIDDIVRDALVLKPILETLYEFKQKGQLNTFPLVASRLESLFKGGISDYLDKLTDPTILEPAVARNQGRYV